MNYLDCLEVSIHKNNNKTTVIKTCYIEKYLDVLLNANLRTYRTLERTVNLYFAEAPTVSDSIIKIETFKVFEFQ